MTRRAAVLDALEPAAVASLSRATFAKLGIKPGDMVRVTTRRGDVELDSRQDDAIPDGVVFIPFAFVEAAANILTNPALDPFGKIPEFKFCAAKVEPAETRRVAAEEPSRSFQEVGNPSPLTPIAALNGVSSGSKANVRTQKVMSALSPKADICSAARHVR